MHAIFDNASPLLPFPMRSPVGTTTTVMHHPDPSLP
jgi:hypothetical protein